MNDNNLREIRIDRGISISELARRSCLSRVTVTDIESGRRNPTVKTVRAICHALNLEPNKIFFGVSVNHEFQKVKWRKKSIDSNNVG